jgi:hypothetical protein
VSTEFKFAAFVVIVVVVVTVGVRNWFRRLGSPYSGGAGALSEEERMAAASRASWLSCEEFAQGGRPTNYGASEMRCSPGMPSKCFRLRDKRNTVVQGTRRNPSVVILESA